MGRRRSRPSAVQKGLVLIRWIGEKSKDEKKSKPLMAQDFYYATTPDGYKTYVALRELFEPETEKVKISFLRVTLPWLLHSRRVFTKATYYCRQISATLIQRLEPGHDV